MTYDDDRIDPNDRRAAARKLLEAQIPLDPISPIYQHVPRSPTQLAMLQSDAYYKLVLGGGRSGKTTVCLMDLAMAMRGIHPWKPWKGPYRTLAFAISRKQAAMVVGYKLLEQCEFPPHLATPEYPDIGLQPFIPKWEIADIGMTRVGFKCVTWIKLHNGCDLWMGWSDDEDSWKRAQGPKVGYVYIDENAGTKKLLIECRKRLQDSQHVGDWRGCLVWGGHGTDDNDAFSEFHELCASGASDHALFHLKPGETGAVDQAAQDRFAKVLTPEERAIHITATGEALDLVRIFKNQWSAHRHMTQAPYDHDPTDNLYVGYDPGVDHPMGMIVVAVKKPKTPDEKPRLEVVKCWNRRGGTIVDDALELKEWLRGRKLAGFVYDTNLKNHDRGGGPSVLDQLKANLREHGVEVIAWWQSKKRHEPGINLLRQWLLMDRIFIRACFDDGGRMLIIQLVKYKGKESTKFTGAGGIVKKDDELVDCLRYVCMELQAIGLAWREDWTAGTPMAAPPAHQTEWDLELKRRQAGSWRGRRSSTRLRPFSTAGDGPKGGMMPPIWMRLRAETDQYLREREQS